MSQSAGAGSPVSFLCPKERDERYHFYRWNGPIPGIHQITLTGRKKPYRAKPYSALGVRSTTTSREWECSCGRTGWSNHVDLEKREQYIERMNHP